jgi:hypothetical protein
MDEARLCIACGTNLTGPFQPGITLTQVLPAEGTDEEKLMMEAGSWICPVCGLVHWYVEDQDRERLLEAVAASGGLDAKPGASYERRTQMVRMLRRVRRM